jgi:hypothetical protein
MQNSYLSFVTDLDPKEEDAKPEQELPESIFGIVCKKQSERASSENAIIFRYLIKKGIFRFLTEKLTMEVVKNMVRQGNLRVYGKGEIFMFEGKRVKTVEILLIGEAIVLSSEERSRVGEER